MGRNRRRQLGPVRWNQSLSEVPERGRREQLPILEAATRMRTGFQHGDLRRGFNDAMASAIHAGIGFVGRCGDIR